MEFKEEARNENIKLNMLDPDDVFVVDAQDESNIYYKLYNYF